MILPILRGLLSFQNAPVTWSLVFLNCFVMSFSTVFSTPKDRDFNSLTKDKSFVEIQGAIYQSYLRARSEHKLKRDLASLVNEETEKNHYVLGLLAFRDNRFLESQLEDSHFVDEVAFKYWKEKIDRFVTDQSATFSQILGVSTYSHSPISWLSYMFTHGGWTHLFSNMVFLLIIGGALEGMIGGLGLLMIYLFSGFIGGAIFILLSGLSAAPLVGASGAVSGLITTFAVLNWKTPVRYFYWLIIPIRKTIGFVYMPGAFIFYLWIMADMAGFLSSSSYIGGIAHSAHLGGHLAGFVAGLTLLIMTKRKPTPPEEMKEMYKLIPFLTELKPARSP